MKLFNIDEPLLEFGKSTHICPRAGIALHDVYDSRFSARRDRILIGAVGTSDTLSRLHNWIERCSNSIPPKQNAKQPNLFPGFCGVNSTTGFRASFVIGDEITRALNNSDVRKILKIRDWNEKVNEAVNLYYEEVRFLAQNRAVDVIVCIIPTDLYKSISEEIREPVEEPTDDEVIPKSIETNFRRALKAMTMHLGKPLQLMRELSTESNARTQQDDATKAWNFCTALYYKANQTVPWKLVTNVNRPSICFVGIGFYRSRDKSVLNTSLAQIFDELGNGVILRGTPVDFSKDDRQAHLSAEQAYDLLQRALKEYEIAVGSAPGRLVLHKSSNFIDDEIEGFSGAVTEGRIKAVDFVTIMKTDLRLLRERDYPPYRGTHVELDKNTHLLYTRGSVAYYKTYPGRYIPQPLEVRIVESDESAGVICKEILGLTKMNWNNTQFDGKYPITIECARRVGEIMKYLDEDDEPQIRYSFYM